MKDEKLVHLLNKVVEKNKRDNDLCGFDKYDTYTGFDKDIINVNASLPCGTTLLMCLIQDQIEHSAYYQEYFSSRYNYLDNPISHIIYHKDFEVDRVNIHGYTALNYALQNDDVHLSEKLLDAYFQQTIYVSADFKDNLLSYEIFKVYDIDYVINLYNKIKELRIKLYQ